jgi:hypothetical protein
MRYLSTEFLVERYTVALAMNADKASSRADLESAISADLRELMSESDQISRLFATAHDVRPTDFRALLHIMVAETAGQPMT